MGDSKIEWTDATWNAIRGCSRVSPGCGDSTGGGCYAERQAHRFAGEGQPYEGLTRATKGGPRWTGKVRFIPKMLIDPLKWRRPKRIFVNSMSDLFHEKLKNEEIAAVFGIMAAAPQHQYQCLTKRPERMRDWFKWLDGMAAKSAEERAARDYPRIAWDERALICWNYAEAEFSPLRNSTWCADFMNVAHDIRWPLDSVWLGVSVENQKYADERIPPLMETPAVIRFLSVEPLLGPVDLRPWIGDGVQHEDDVPRERRLLGSDHGGDRDRHRRPSLEDSRSAMGSLVGSNQVDSVQAASCGEKFRGVSPGPNDGRQPQVLRTSPSTGVASSSRANSRGTNGEPQERYQNRQSAIKPGVGNDDRATNTRREGPGAWENHAPVRDGQLDGQAGRISGHGNTKAQGDRGGVVTDRQGLRDKHSDSVGNLSREDQKISWVICGSESGPGARPMELDWVRSLRDQCAGTLTKFFLKQFSSPSGKKFSLPVLDGRQHLEFPS